MGFRGSEMSKLLRLALVTLSLYSVFCGAARAQLVTGFSINPFTAQSITVTGQQIVLSGATVSQPLGNFDGYLSGSSTITGNTSLSMLNVATDGDNAAIPNGAFDSILVQTHDGGSNYDGGRTGIMAQMVMNTGGMTVSKASAGFVGLGSKVIPEENMGGTSSTALGSFYGGNTWAECHSGATYLTNCIGFEHDASLESGASASNFVIDQFILTSDHATHGSLVDIGTLLAAQVGASTGLYNGMTTGRYDSQWPIDPNGYLWRLETGTNYTTVPTTAAGGIDFLEATFSGDGTLGGGFAFRSPGAQVGESGSYPGFFQSGYGYFGYNASGPVIDSIYEKMSSVSSIQAGGSNWAATDLAADQYGDIVKITSQTSGAVTGVSIVASGWQTTPPSNPVTFSALDSHGSSFGTGLTLNLTWTPETTLNLNPSGGPVNINNIPVIVNSGIPELQAFSTQIPFIWLSSGSIGNNGALTGITALPTAYAYAYVLVPAGAIATGIPAAATWYFAEFSSTTAATIYNNTYVSGNGTQPTCPGGCASPSPTAFSTTGPGSFTGVSSATNGPDYSLPAGTLGIRDTVRMSYRASVTNTSASKTIGASFGGSNAFATAVTTVASIYQIGNCSNRDNTASQICGSNNASPGTNANAFVYLAKSTATAAQDIAFAGTNATPATNNIVLESAQIELLRSP